MPADNHTKHLQSRVKNKPQIDHSEFNEDQWERLLGTALIWAVPRYVIRVLNLPVEQTANPEKEERRAYCKRRKAEGAKLPQIAKELGISVSYVSRLLTGSR